MLRLWTLFAGLLLAGLAAMPTTVLAQPMVLLPHRPITILLPHAPGPRFVVKALELKALDETGWDHGGNDEVVAIFGTDGYTLIGPNYWQYNSDGSVHRFRYWEDCIYPARDNGEYDHSWRCNESGGPAPLRFTVGLYEQDDDFSMGFCANQSTAAGDLFPARHKPCEADSPNDLIGKNAFNYSLETLLNWLPRVGMSLRARAIIGYECDQTTSGTCGASEPAYRLVYQITRVPDGT